MSDKRASLLFGVLTAAGFVAGSVLDSVASLVFSIVLTVADLITGTFSVDAGIGLLGGLYYFAVLIPSLSVSIRRLHDTGRSGWWILIVLIPLIGVITLLVFTVQDSESGNNAYGPNPKLTGASY